MIKVKTSIKRCCWESEKDETVGKNICSLFVYVMITIKHQIQSERIQEKKDKRKISLRRDRQQAHDKMEDLSLKVLAFT